MDTYGDLGDADLLNIFGFVDTLGTQYANPNNKVPPPPSPIHARFHMCDNSSKFILLCS